MFSLVRVHSTEAYFVPYQTLSMMELFAESFNYTKFHNGCHGCHYPKNTSDLEIQNMYLSENLPVCQTSYFEDNHFMYLILTFT